MQADVWEGRGENGEGRGGRSQGDWWVVVVGMCGGMGKGAKGCRVGGWVEVIVPVQIRM